MRDLALFNLVIDSKLHGCNLVSLRVCDISQGKIIYPRAIVMQRKTHRPVQFEITELTQQSVAAWIGNPPTKSPHLYTRQYARIVAGWVKSIGLDPATYGTHTMRRTKRRLSTGERRTFGPSNSFLDIPSWRAQCDTLTSKSTMRRKWQSRQKREVCLQSYSASIQIVAVRP